MNQKRPKRAIEGQVNKADITDLSLIGAGSVVRKNEKSPDRIRAFY